MPRYVMLMRYHSSGMKAISKDPGALHEIHEAIGRWEAKVLESYRLLGEWDQITIFDAPDNFKQGAPRAAQPAAESPAAGSPAAGSPAAEPAAGDFDKFDDDIPF